MANITVLALDPQTGDLCFDANGMLMLREDAEAIAQNVRNNLLTWKGEFPLNTDHGTDWERVVQQPRSEAVDEADSVVRSSIFQEPYGVVKFYSKEVPAADISTCIILFGKGGGGESDLTVATREQLGHVKIGNGIEVTEDGTISANAKVSEDQIATSDDTSEMLKEIYGE